MTIAYKVVYIRYGLSTRRPFVRRVSQAVTGEWELEYEKDKWTRPKETGTKLFVFATLSHAMAYAGSNIEPIEVWECEAENMVPVPDRIPHSGWQEAFKAFWDGFPLGKPTKMAEMKAPAGSMVCDAVMLKTKIWSWER